MTDRELIDRLQVALPLSERMEMLTQELAGDAAMIAAALRGAVAHLGRTNPPPSPPLSALARWRKRVAGWWV